MRPNLLHLLEGLAAALFEEQARGRQDAQEAPHLHPVVVVLASLLLATTIVAMTTLIAFGLDALLHIDQQLDHDTGAWMRDGPCTIPPSPTTALSPVCAARRSAARFRQRLRDGASPARLAIGGHS
jgi:hypothetical protein